MIDIRRKTIDVRYDRREHPRLEFHCTAIVGHLKDVLRVTDLSLGGVFIELKDKNHIKPEQVIDVAIKFPTQDKAIRVKAKVAGITDRGIGCRFQNLSSQHQETIKFCFETFKDTIPIS